MCEAADFHERRWASVICMSEEVEGGRGGGVDGLKQTHTLSFIHWSPSRN